MSIERTNILSLIGGNGRYHSCILTTYSFDFHFFEMKMMKWLRSCGVSNTSVYIDGHFYSELMQNPTGEEMSKSSNYSLIPIFEKSIFHPKILMLFGNNEGLLIVGSGNLTNSGNGNNDEIWGAYHFDVKNPKNTWLFSNAWQYFILLSSNAKGVNFERVSSWITDNSKWLEKLPVGDFFQFSKISEDESIAFLYNSDESSIWQNVLRLIEEDTINEILIVSPYYDSDGKTLAEIKNEFPTASINVVLDESGVLPHNLQSENDFSFYDWKELNVSRNLGVKQKSRLHAKILYLKASNGVEYCLFGSANITSAGLGLFGVSNNEVSLFVKSTKNNLLNRIGIKIKSNSKKLLSDFEATKNNDILNLIINKNRFRYKIYLVELHESKLTIYSNIDKETKLIIVFYDKNNQIYRQEKVEKITAQYVLKINSNDEYLHYIQFQDLKGIGISNKILISKVESIIRTHPNPRNAAFEKALSQFQNGELSNILDLIHYASTDDTEKQDGIYIAVSSRKSHGQSQKFIADQSQLYDLSEYKSVDSKAYLRENSILQSPTLQVLDAIKFSKTNNPAYHKELRSDEQMGDTSSMDGNEKYTAIQEELIQLRFLEVGKRKIRKYFSDFHHYLHHQILFKNLELSKYKLTLVDFSKYLIALELIHIYGGKTQFVENEQINFNYLPLSGDYEVDNVKGFCLNIIGDFLRLARNGFKNYDFEYTNKKFKQLQSDAFVNTLVCILNVSWLNYEKHYFITLLLNTLHYLGWDNVFDFDQNIGRFFPKLKERANTLTHKSRVFDKQLDYFKNRVCPAFRKANYNRAKKIFKNNAHEDQIIYLSSHGIGYSCVSSVYNRNEYTLVRAGFKWNEKMRQFSNPYGDENDKRVRITKMTIVDL